jgi:hypothetical protein
MNVKIFSFDQALVCASMLLIIMVAISFSATLIPSINYGSFGNALNLHFSPQTPTSNGSMKYEFTPESHFLHEWKIYEVISSMIGYIVVSALPARRYIAALTGAISLAAVLRFVCLFVSPLQQTMIVSIGQGFMKSVSESIVMHRLLMISKSHLSTLYLLEAAQTFGSSFSALNYFSSSGYNVWSSKAQIAMLMSLLICVMLCFVLARVQPEVAVNDESSSTFQYPIKRYWFVAISCLSIALWKTLESNYPQYDGASNFISLETYSDAEEYQSRRVTSCQHELSGMTRTTLCVVLSVIAVKIRSGSLLMVCTTSFLTGYIFMFQSPEVTCESIALRGPNVMVICSIAMFTPLLYTITFYRLRWTIVIQTCILISGKIGEIVSLLFFYIYYKHALTLVNFTLHGIDFHYISFHVPELLFRTVVHYTAIIGCIVSSGLLSYIYYSEWRNRISVNEGLHTVFINHLFVRNTAVSHSIDVEMKILRSKSIVSEAVPMSSRVLDFDKELIINVRMIKIID